MEAVFGLQVMLLGVSYGVETHCDGRRDGAQCSGALGGTVKIQLMNSNSETFRFQLFKSKQLLLTLRNNSIVYNKTQENSVFIPNNGTFIIKNLSKNDSGNYSLETFNSDGTSVDERTLQLFLQAPVCSVLLLSECLSQGQLRVSCSSVGGDSPQYSWTLDGRTLTDAELLSANNEGNIITLRPHVSGHLVCSVRTSVSDVFKEERIFACSILPIIGGVLAALAFFLFVGVAVICALMKKQHNKCLKKDDDQEVSYTDIRIMTHQGEQVEQGAEMEVEYGQVRFSQGLRLTEPTGDDCLYVNVHKINRFK